MKLTIWRIEYNYEDTTICNYGAIAFLITDGGTPPIDEIIALFKEQNSKRTYTIQKIEWLPGPVLVHKSTMIPFSEARQ